MMDLQSNNRKGETEEGKYITSVIVDGRKGETEVGKYITSVPGRAQVTGQVHLRCAGSRSVCKAFAMVVHGLFEF